MKFLLDTNIIVAILRGDYAVQQRTYGIGLDKCFLPEIALAELYAGAYKSGNPRAFEQLSAIKNLFKVIPISDSLEKYGEIRATLERDGLRIDDMDLLIAATAMANGLTLVSHNSRHFDRIPGLQLADFIME